MTIITNEGKKLITHSIINKLDLFISKVVYADCNLDTLDESTTSLTNIKYENLPTSIRIDEFDNSKIIFEAVLRNDTAQDFFINCVGFIAKNGELLCFTKIKRTPVLSKATDTNASLFHYKLAIELKNAKDLSIKIDETIVYPTLAHFNASQKAQDEKIDKLGLDKVNTSDFTASQNLQDEKIKTLETDKADKLNVFTRDEINVKLNAKADKATTYTKTEVDTSQNAQNTKISALETNKADKTQLANYYTKLESNNLLNAKVNTKDFITSKLDNGYAKLPNGLILQWGKTNVSKVIFPIAFPTKALSVTCNSFLQSHLAVANCFNISNTGFESGGHYCTGSQWYANSTIDKYWFAIGY